MATSYWTNRPDQRQDRRRSLGGTRDHRGRLDQSRWQASGCQQTTSSHLPPVGRRSRGCGHPPARPPKEEKTGGTVGAGWLLCASSGNSTDHCNIEHRRREHAASYSDARTGGCTSPSGHCRASGAGAVEETFLRHILSQVKTVSIYTFDVSFAFCIGCYYLLNLSLNVLDRRPPKAPTS